MAKDLTEADVRRIVCDELVRIGFPIQDLKIDGRPTYDPRLDPTQPMNGKPGNPESKIAMERRRPDPAPPSPPRRPEDYMRS